jgi:hypothetical protein
MENNTNGTGSKTIEFINLIKCILEYYATTKKIKPSNDISEESVGDLLNTLKDLESEHMMSIDLPNNINESIESAFISHLKFFEKQVKDCM